MSPHRYGRFHFAGLALNLCALLLLLAGSVQAAAGDTLRLSLASDGTQADGPSFSPSISADGYFVAFHSQAGNLVDGDTNGAFDVFVRDRWENTTERISVASDGAQGNDASMGPSISADGRYVTFYSKASNLVESDTNKFADIFVHDRLASITRRVSVGWNGAEANGVSSGGFITPNGRYVVFLSRASNLVSLDRNGKVDDIFVRDLLEQTTSLVSILPDGTQAGYPVSPSLSADGRLVAFVSTGQVYVRDLQAGTTVCASVNSAGEPGDAWTYHAVISADGHYVAFQSEAANLVAGDTNGAQDIFLRDLRANLTTRLSLASDGTQANDHSVITSISADGRLVSFTSAAGNLVDGDTNDVADIFMHERQSNQTWRASLGFGGVQADGNSQSASLSADGRFVAFVSEAGNLVDGDTNGAADVFVHENDITPPLVLSITRLDPNPTRATSVTFNVTFSEPVTGVNTLDFALEAPGLEEAAVASVRGGPVEYSVLVDTGIGSGTLRLDVVKAPSIFDLYGNSLPGPYTDGERYTLDWIPPAVTAVRCASPNPTNAGQVAFAVTFSEPVTGVELADFSLLAAGIHGAALEEVSGGPVDYTVTAGTGSGDGTLRLAIVKAPGIQDLAGNLFPGAYAGSASCSLDRTAPQVLSISRAGSNPASAGSLVYLVTFSELVVDVDPSDFDLAASGLDGAGIEQISRGPSAGYLISVHVGPGNGTLRLDLVEQPDILDSAGNALPGPYTDGESYLIDRIAPFVLSSTRATPNPSTGYSLGFIVRFSEPVSSVEAGDFRLFHPGLDGASLIHVSSGPAAVYFITVNPGTGAGPLRLDLVDDDSIMDLAGNPMGGVGEGNGDFSAGEVFDVLVFRIYLPLVQRDPS